MRGWLTIFVICFYACVSQPTKVRAETESNHINASDICIQKGWKLVQGTISGQPREFFWKGPKGPWVKGAIIVMHGGGGSHYHFCAEEGLLTGAQVRFTEKAIQQGFGVFILHSTDIVTDNEGRLCGKVWDDEVRDRSNLDLPYIRDVITSQIPKLRPKGSAPSIFLTGLSSGGYMTVRAATEFPDLITAFAPIASGDPYGWNRVCIPKPGGRKTVHGAGFDNDTGKEIINRNSCISESGYQNERPWPEPQASQKPPFKIFHHRKDGVHDFSCNERLRTQLLAHGYPEDQRFIADSRGFRRLAHHFWIDEYNEPLLEFFAQQSSR